jgi:uncharacterized protein YyaL (SSP411 family)
MINLLSDSQSKYLLQHKDNPVAWQIWSNETLNYAKTVNKPLFISIGYSSCHWCHIMADDCFKDDEIAKFLNENFIPVKIDKEEYPDVDKYYQSFLQATRQQGGWPLSIFATPEGKPFYGGTYFPKKQSFGLPPFIVVLKEVLNLYENQKYKINNVVSSFENFNKKLAEIKIEDNDKIDFNNIYNIYAQMLDFKNGGLKGTTKFPNIPILLFLLEKYYDNENIENFLKLTAKKLCLSGIYDHIRGGFFRYTVDSEWNIPHFEKMLYDNALNVTFLIRMFDKTDDPLFLHISKKTLNFLIEYMSNNNGLIASINADSINNKGNSEEGYFYKIFNKDVESLTEKEASLFAKYSIFNENVLKFENSDFKTYLSFSRIFEKINKRQLEYKKFPTTDNKIICGWNMLACYALLEFSEISGEEYYFKYGLELFHKIKNSLYNNNKIYRIRYDNHIFQHQTLEDYSYFFMTVEKLFELTREKEFLVLSEKIFKSIIDTFFDNKLLYFNAEKSVFETFDEALPSAFGIFYITAQKLLPYSDLNIPNEIKRMAVDRMIRFSTAHPTLLRC